MIKDTIEREAGFGSYEYIKHIGGQPYRVAFDEQGRYMGIDTINVKESSLVITHVSFKDRYGPYFDDISEEAFYEACNTRVLMYKFQLKVDHSELDVYQHVFMTYFLYEGNPVRVVSHRPDGFYRMHVLDIDNRKLGEHIGNMDKSDFKAQYREISENEYYQLILDKL
ncbi:hypothetical protein [Flagellimonas myxillae]|uniref:hypothetical protein n=1 Tax=Flagellimonas myxillae TaxID=2942214 RepID=UPI00201E84D6|nr:hypothetical protein [Muricauda myxillae]MCL6265057.1 hypothetical protein [Muricauda myxillae]